MITKGFVDYWLVETCVILEGKETGWEETAGNLAENVDQEPRIDLMAIYYIYATSSESIRIYKETFIIPIPPIKLFNFSFLQNDRFEFPIIYIPRYMSNEYTFEINC